MKDNLYAYIDKKGNLKYCKYKNKFRNFLNRILCKHTWRTYPKPRTSMFISLNEEDDTIALCSKCGKVR